jgi:hypothetical protein
MASTFPWLSIGLILAVGPDWESTTYALNPTKIHLQVECGRPATQTAPTPRENAKRSEMWWRGDVARIAFGIDKRRSKELEVIFQQTLPMLKTLRADVLRKEAIISQLLENASTTNESVVVLAVEDLEISRRSLARTFTMMHYHMYLRLTSAQRKKVHAYLYEHAEPSANGPRDGNNPSRARRRDISPRGGRALGPDGAEGRQRAKLQKLMLSPWAAASP